MFDVLVFDMLDVPNMSGVLDILVDGIVERKRLTYRYKVDLISSIAPVGIKTLCQSKPYGLCQRYQFFNGLIPVEDYLEDDLR
jgi:hypothetical protein